MRRWPTVLLYRQQKRRRNRAVFAVIFRKRRGRKAKKEHTICMPRDPSVAQLVMQGCFLRPQAHHSTAHPVAYRRRNSREGSMGPGWYCSSLIPSLVKRPSMPIASPPKESSQIKHQRFWTDPTRYTCVVDARAVRSLEYASTVYRQCMMTG